MISIVIMFIYGYIAQKYRDIHVTKAVSRPRGIPPQSTRPIKDSNPTRLLA